MLSLETFKKIVQKTEDSDIPLYYFILTLIFLFSLRIFLEVITNKVGISLQSVLHYASFFTLVGLSMIILVHIFSKEKIVKIFKVISVGFVALLILPVVDLIVNQATGFNELTYYKGDLIKGFLTIGKLGEGLTTGIRLEIIAFLLVVFFYLRSKNVSMIKSLVGSFIFYCALFFYGILPTTVMPHVLSFFGIKFMFTSPTMINTLFFGIVLLAIILAFLLNRKNFLVIFKSIRLSRVFYYWLMFFFGFLLSWQATGGFGLNSENFFYLFFILLSILLASIFSTVTNSIANMEIDKISSQSGPLIRDDIDTYKKIIWYLLAASLVCALAVDFRAFFLILFCIGNCFIYSMPPLRIKKIFLLSKLVILLNSLAMVILGFVVFTSNSNIPNFLNIIANFADNTNYFGWIALFSALLFWLASNFIDIKDYESDRSAGTKTLPTVVGLKNSKLLIGSAFLLLYIIIGLLLGNKMMLAALIITGCIEFWLINRKNYQEKYVFGFYLASLLLIFWMIF